MSLDNHVAAIDLRTHLPYTGGERCGSCPTPFRWSSPPTAASRG